MRPASAVEITKLKKQVSDSSQKFKEKLAESKQTARDFERVQGKLKDETARHMNDTAKLKKQIVDGQLRSESKRREAAREVTKLKKQVTDSSQKLIKEQEDLDQAARDFMRVQEIRIEERELHARDVAAVLLCFQLPSAPVSSHSLSGGRPAAALQLEPAALLPCLHFLSAPGGSP